MSRPESILLAASGTYFLRSRGRFLVLLEVMESKNCVVLGLGHFIATEEDHLLSNRQKNGIGCFVLALLAGGVAIRNTFFVPKVELLDESGLGVSRMFGAFLTAIALLGLGVWLFQKPKVVPKGHPQADSKAVSDSKATRKQ